MNPEYCPFVSVIIPVYNDAKRLRICLDALEKQTYPEDKYEVIVIDNASDEGEIVTDIVKQYPQATATCENIPGSYAARNKGLSIAKGEVIAFTDADCIPAQNWLEKGVEHLLKTPNCGLVAGKVELFFKEPHQPTPVELYESVTAFPQQKLLEKSQGAATANIFTWREVFNKVGNFNASLKSNGDVEWGKRVFLAGYQQVYVEDICVAHPARYSWSELHKRTVRLAGGVYGVYIKETDSWIQRNKMFARLIFDDLIPPVNFIINAFKNSRLENLDQKTKVSLTIFFVRYVSAWEKFKLKLGGTANRG